MSGRGHPNWISSHTENIRGDEVSHFPTPPLAPSWHRCLPPWFPSLNHIEKEGYKKLPGVLRVQLVGLGQPAWWWCCEFYFFAQGYGSWRERERETEREDFEEDLVVILWSVAFFVQGCILVRFAQLDETVEKKLIAHFKPNGMDLITNLTRFSCKLLIIWCWNVSRLSLMT